MSGPASANRGVARDHSQSPKPTLCVGLAEHDVRSMLLALEAGWVFGSRPALTRACLAGREGSLSSLIKPPPQSLFGPVKAAGA